MQAKKIDRYKQKLLEMRERLTSETQHLVQSIQEDVNPSGNLSSVPVHMADVATESLEADVHVLERERGMLDDIEAALERAEDGSYGACQNCGADIAEERLDAIPYVSLCIKCAQSTDQPTRGAWTPAP